MTAEDRQRQPLSLLSTQHPAPSTQHPALNMDIEARAAEFGRRYESLRAEIGKVIVGHGEIVEGVLTCMLAGGHGLLEGVPGLGKTPLVRTLSQALRPPFARHQFPPDRHP